MSITGTGFSFEGTHVISAEPVRPGDACGTLVLHGDNVEGVLCLCRPEVANYAHVLIAAGDTPTATLDGIGNVVSIQTSEGCYRVEFPKRGLTMTNPDAYVAIGDVFDYEGELRTVRRDFDCLLLPAVQLAPQQVRVLEKHIAAYWNELARYRLRTVELHSSGIDVTQCREDLATFPGLGGDPDDLESFDWLEVGRRLEAVRPYGGYADLRKLCALLLADDVNAEAGR